MVFGLAGLSLALTVDGFINGLTRPFFAWCPTGSGARTRWPGLRAGRRRDNAMAGHPGVSGWCSSAGARSLEFPSTLTDTFGSRNAARNYGCLYIAQGISAIFGGPLASLLHDATGSWVSVFFSLLQSRQI
jgi:OFA family oxalate/formate antiporter-like MFS transporter